MDSIETLGMRGEGPVVGASSGICPFNLSSSFSYLALCASSASGERGSETRVKIEVRMEMSTKLEINELISYKWKLKWKRE